MHGRQIASVSPRKSETVVLHPASDDLLTPRQFRDNVIQCGGASNLRKEDILAEFLIEEKLDGQKYFSSGHVSFALTG